MEELSLARAVHPWSRRQLCVLLAVLLVTALGEACGSAQPDRPNRDPQHNTSKAPTTATPDTMATPDDTSTRASISPRDTWTGDFDVLLQRRVIRMLVPYSPTLFYHDRGRARGILATASLELEKFLSKKFPADRPFTVVMIPTTSDRLFQGLVDGEGDVAAGAITITAERLKRFDFTTPTFTEANQVFVTGPGAPDLRSPDDLAGQMVHVSRSRSSYQNLLALNEQFEHPDPPRRPMRRMRIELLPDELASEDVLDMVNVGLVRIAVCQEWRANLWAKHLPNLRVHHDLVLREATQLGWALRLQSPKLKAVLDEFIARARATGLFNSILVGAEADARVMHNASRRNEMKKFEATVNLFRRYAQEYQFDYLLLSAQGYQESRLDQKATSRVGAVGIMQLMPATGAEMRVGDIHSVEANIHAGAKYLARLLHNYFPDAKFDERNRTLFAFAAYNAGPANIARIRRQAVAEGIDPDVWFNQVEHVAARRIGQETVTYVRNIFKYYVAYKLAQQTEAERAQAVEQLKREANDSTQDDDGNR